MEFSPIFEPLFSDNIDDKRYYQAYGGRGGGKSLAVAGAAVIKTYSKYQHKIIFLRQIMDSQEESTIAEVKNVLELLGCSSDFKYKANKFTNKLTGATIVFKGIQAQGSQSAKLKSLSGVTTLIIEEAEELKSFEEFSKVDEGVRVIGKPLKIILVYNPGSAIKSWIHKEWFVDGKPNEERFHDTVYMHSTYLDNLKNLAPSTVQRYNDLRKTNPNYYIHTILAEWTLGTAGRVYEGWEEYPEFNEVGTVWYGLDFGYGGKDRTSLIEINYYDSVYYIREVVFGEKMLISTLLAHMRISGVKRNAEIYADSAVPNFITEIRKGGFTNIRAVKKGPNSKEQGIKKVQDAAIVIIGENPNLYYHYVTYCEVNGKLPHEPDSLAALRYGITGKRVSASGEVINKGSSVIRGGRYS